MNNQNDHHFEGVTFFQGDIGGVYRACMVDVYENETVKPHGRDPIIIDCLPMPSGSDLQGGVSKTSEFMEVISYITPRSRVK